jgi:hypothetical protein
MSHSVPDVFIPVGIKIRSPDACPLHESRRLRDLPTLEKLGQLPGLVAVAIPVESADEPGALELIRIEIEIGVAEPCLKFVGYAKAIKLGPPTSLGESPPSSRGWRGSFSRADLRRREVEFVVNFSLHTVWLTYRGSEGISG